MISNDIQNKTELSGCGDIVKKKERDIFPVGAFSFPSTPNKKIINSSVKKLKSSTAIRKVIVKPEQNTKYQSRSLTDLINHEDLGLPNSCKKRKKLSTLCSEINITKGSPLKMSAPRNETTNISEKENKAATKIQNALMLFAWRRRREENEQLKEDLVQAQSFQMQVFLLRQLLDKEKNRVEETKKENNEHKHEVKKIEIEKQQLIRDNEELQNNINLLNIKINEKETEIKNIKNDLNTARTEAKNWEKQLLKERDKVSKLKKENKALLEEVQEKEKQFQNKNKEAIVLLRENTNLKSTVQQQRNEQENAKAELNKIFHQVREMQLLVQQKDEKYNKSLEEIKKLEEIINLLEEEVIEKDTMNGELGKSMAERSMELVVAEKKIQEFTSLEKSWSHQINKMVTLCARVPFACLYTSMSLLGLLPPRPNVIFRRL